VAIAAPFVILALAWRYPKYRDDASGRALPPGVTRAVDADWFRWLVRLAGLAFAGYVAMALLFGPV
jgi:hypothetical protein